MVEVFEDPTDPRSCVDWNNLQFASWQISLWWRKEEQSWVGSGGNILNPTGTYCIPGNRTRKLITGTEVSAAVKQLCSGTTLGWIKSALNILSLWMLLGWMPPWRGVLAMIIWEKTQGQSQDTLERLYCISCLSWEQLWILLDELVKVTGGKSVWVFLLKLFPPRPRRR